MNTFLLEKLRDQHGRKILAFTLLVLMSAFLSSCFNASAESRQQIERIQGKAKLAQQGVKEKNRSGQDVSSMLKLMSQVKPNLDKGDFNEAEALLDNVLSMLKSSGSQTDANRKDNAYVTSEFGRPERVNIIGYSDDAMEPFISRDGKYLFFNNLNDPDINTNIFYAEKKDALNYVFKGEVKGINTSALEGVPTMDENNKFCFVSTREFKKTRLTLFCGDFKDGTVSRLHTIGSSLGKKKGMWLYMGPELSPDGDTLYYTESNLDTRTGVPKALNILVANYKNGHYYKAGNSDEIMKNINTGELEYAPSISSDGLELFFTRASELIVGNQSAGKNLKIFIAKRKNTDEPFGVPREIDSINGFVEGPTVMNAGNNIYYHARENSRFNIYRVTRNNKS